MLTPVILSGGAGMRLWPVSREGRPKPFMKLHHHRSEHWIVVSGMAKVTNGERNIYVNTNESTYIPAGHRHRLENPGILGLVMIEVQSSEYLGEDDVVHFDDRYGRA